MKNLLILLFTASLIISCSKSSDEPILVNSNPHNLQNLGLKPENNIYPYYPDTSTIGLGDNIWSHTISGDTLKVYRRAEVSDDSGDGIWYTFLIKSNEWIVPLKVKRVVNDAYLAVPIIGLVAYDKPIEVFKLQGYEEKKYLACQIETSNGHFWGPGTLVDKMWIDLTK